MVHSANSAELDYFKLEVAIMMQPQFKAQLRRRGSCTASRHSAAAGPPELEAAAAAARFKLREFHWQRAAHWQSARAAQLTQCAHRPRAAYHGPAAAGATSGICGHTPRAHKRTRGHTVT